MRNKDVLTILAGLLLLPSTLFAQGQDSTIPERELMIISEFLDGSYDNANQTYFDTRRKIPEARRHGRRHVKIKSIENASFGDNVFLFVDYRGSDQKAVSSASVLSLRADNDAEAVRMRRHAIDLQERDGSDLTAYASALQPEKSPQDDGCDLLWRRDAGQFRATTANDRCAPSGGARGTTLQNEWLLSEDALWIRRQVTNGRGKTIEGPIDGVFDQLERARRFECYADVPGVGGGRDEDYKRYGPYESHDLGGIVSFQTDGPEAQNLTITLRRVDWPINNYEGVFTRDSLVVYLTEKLADDSTKSHGYTFSQPDAERLGLNLHWILAYCYQESNAEARPTF